jgi:hypothetical protein
MVESGAQVERPGGSVQDGVALRPREPGDRVVDAVDLRRRLPPPRQLWVAGRTEAPDHDPRFRLELDAHGIAG